MGRVHRLDGLVVLWGVGLSVFVCVPGAMGAVGALDPAEPASPALRDAPLVSSSAHEGLYVGSAVGVFRVFPRTGGHSSAQPYTTLKVGWAFGPALGLELASSAGFVAGHPTTVPQAGSEDRWMPATPYRSRPLNYGLFGLTAATVLTYQPRSKFWFASKLGVGAARIAHHSARTMAERIDLPRVPWNGVPWDAQILGGLAVGFLPAIRSLRIAMAMEVSYLASLATLALAPSLGVDYQF